MIKSAYDRANREILFRGPGLKRDTRNLEEEVSEIGLKRSRYENGGNTTSIETQMDIAPGGMGMYIVNIGTGESTMTVSATDMENAVHGNYKNSKINLF